MVKKIKEEGDIMNNQIGRMKKSYIDFTTII
jgi:hypothetical protein